MKPDSLFALIALLPAALNAAPAAAKATVPLCTGDGAVRSLELPFAPAAPGREPGPCCQKGCHSGQSRKRTMREFDPSQ